MCRARWSGPAVGFRRCCGGGDVAEAVLASGQIVLGVILAQPAAPLAWVRSRRSIVMPEAFCDPHELSIPMAGPVGAVRGAAPRSSRRSRRRRGLSGCEPAHQQCRLRSARQRPGGSRLGRGPARDGGGGQLLGVLNCCRAFAPGLDRGGGRGDRQCAVHRRAGQPARGGEPYSASKAAALSLSEDLRGQLADKGVQVTAVIAGPILTDMARAPAGRHPAAAVARAILDGVAGGCPLVFPIRCRRAWRRLRLPTLGRSSSGSNVARGVS